MIGLGFPEFLGYENAGKLGHIESFTAVSSRLIAFRENLCWLNCDQLESRSIRIFGETNLYQSLTTSQHQEPNRSRTAKKR